MKFFIITVFLISQLISAEMPPMPPMMTDTKQNSKTSDTNFSSKLKSISECGALPPMIIFLPPPMETSLISCRNKYYKPSIKEANKKLSKLFKKSIKVKKIQIVKKFREVYKISIKNGKKTYIKYCNKDLDFCLIK